MQALAQARASAQKLREEGKLPPEDRSQHVAPEGSQQVIASGGQEYRDLGLSGRTVSNAIEAGNFSSRNFSTPSFEAQAAPSRAPEPAPMRPTEPMSGGYRDHGNHGGHDHGRGGHGGGGNDRGGHRGGGPGSFNNGGQNNYNQAGYNKSFVNPENGIGPQGHPNFDHQRGGGGGRHNGGHRGRGRGGGDFVHRGGSRGGGSHGGHDDYTGVSRRGGFDGGFNDGGHDGGRGGGGGFDGGRGRGRGGRGRGGRGRGGYGGGNNWEQEGPQEDPDADFKVFVGGLHRDTTTEKLQEYFAQFGPIKYCQVKVDPATGQSRGFGFVVYENTSGVDNVIKTLPHTVDGKRVDAKRQHLKTRDGDDKLFCGGVPSDFTDGQLAEFFSNYGMVDAVERPRDMVTGLAKGFAFITFKDPGIVEMIVSQRWLTLNNGARIECKAAVPQAKNGAAPGLVDPTSYGGYGTTGYDQSGVGYVGDDWQNYDWSKLAQSEPAKEVAVPQAAQANMLASIPGMEGLTQKQINKQMKKMMKQWNGMMEMMAGGDQGQMMNMMSQMVAADPNMMANMGNAAAPPPPPQEENDAKPKRSRFTPY